MKFVKSFFFSAAVIAAIQEDTYFQKNISEIQRVREYTRGQLEQRGFTVLPYKEMKAQ